MLEDAISPGHARLIVGLGNPGREYEGTRHNAGFMAVDCLAKRNGIPAATKVSARFHGQLTDSQVRGHRCFFLKPMTYMNRSGLAVGEAANFYKIDPPRIMVVVDDVALPLGQIRLRAEGGPGGHNGLKDVERALGGRAYPRLRVGIDGPGRVPQKDYVLGRFNAGESKEVDAVLDRVCDAIECWLTDGIDQAMTRYNTAGG